MLAVALVIVCLGAGTLALRTHPSRAAAMAAAANTGYRHPDRFAGDDGDDDNLRGAAEDAGALWAKRHPGRASIACPQYSPAFLKGCASVLNGRRAD